jgi:hypothetical protein
VSPRVEAGDLMAERLRAKAVAALEEHQAQIGIDRGGPPTRRVHGTIIASVPVAFTLTTCSVARETPETEAH